MTDVRNLLVVLTDQQRWDTTGVHGNPMGLTPTFDALAERGVHVRNSFTAHPVCTPSRASLQTGQYATTTGCFRNDLSFPPVEATLARTYAAAGYDTGYVGKWHLGDPGVHGPVPPELRGGYASWLAANHLEFTSHAYETTMYDEQGRPADLPGYRADAVAGAAEAFIRRPRTAPWMLFASFLEPHHQNDSDTYPAPDGYAERYADPWVPQDLAALGGTSAEQLPGYYGMVRRVDEVLARLLGVLEETGAREDTVVLFSSDHGCHFKTRNDEYKRSCHEASIRVPTVLTGPGLDGHGPLDRLVSHVDLPPTLLELTGLPVPASMQGRSLVPDIHGGAGGAEQDEDDVLVQISETQVGRALRTRRWKYAVAAPGVDGWEEMAATDYTETHLYDLDADPAELDNLAGSPAYRDVADRLRARLARRMVESGERPPRISPAS